MRLALHAQIDSPAPRTVAMMKMVLNAFAMVKGSGSR